MKKLFKIVFFVNLIFIAFSGTAFAKKYTYSFKNYSFRKLKESGINLYETSIAEKQTEPLETQSKSLCYLSAGDLELSNVKLHSPEKFSCFLIGFANSEGQLFWGGTTWIADLYKLHKAPQERWAEVPYIEIPVTGKGKLTFTFYELNVKDNPKGVKQEIGVFNEKNELIELKLMDLINKPPVELQAFKADIPDGTQTVRLVMSQKRKEEEPSIKIGLAVENIFFKEK